jgi:hypothetical protein
MLQSQHTSWPSVCPLPLMDSSPRDRNRSPCEEDRWVPPAGSAEGEYASPLVVLPDNDHQWMILL